MANNILGAQNQIEWYNFNFQQIMCKVYYTLDKATVTVKMVIYGGGCKELIF